MRTLEYLGNAWPVVLSKRCKPVTLAITMQTSESSRPVSIIGVGCCLGPSDDHGTEGPKSLKAFGLDERLRGRGIDAEWITTLRPQRSQYKAPASWRTADCYRRLGTLIRRVVRSGKQFLVIGVDQGCAVGTWGSLANATELGGLPRVVWITPGLDTTPAGHEDQSPLACVLGQARQDLLRHAAGRQSLDRDCIYVLCTRQTASPQDALVRRLGLRVAYADDLRKNGFQRLLSDAIAAIASQDEPIGLSIDLRALDLGVGAAGPDGSALAAALRDVVPPGNLLGLEIVGYDPYVDLDGRRAELICELAAAVLGRASSLPAPSASHENGWRRERRTG